jgi:putative oxidoreductase
MIQCMAALNGFRIRRSSFSLGKIPFDRIRRTRQDTLNTAGSILPMQKIFGPFVAGRAAVGLLVIRIFFGIAIAEHGWVKIQHPFAWMGASAPVPGWLQSLAAVSEFGGGLAMIVGLLTPLAMFGIMCTMAFAIIKVHLPAHAPYVAPHGGPSYELAGHYFILALALIIGGPGALSVDAYLFNRPVPTTAYTP